MTKPDAINRVIFIKLFVMVIFVWLCGSALLGLRQLRIQAIHEMAEARGRVVQRDAELFMIRAKIAEQVTPGHLGELIESLGPMEPGVPERLEQLVQDSSEVDVGVGGVMDGP